MKDQEEEYFLEEQDAAKQRFHTADPWRNYCMHLVKIVNKVSQWNLRTNERSIQYGEDWYTLTEQSRAQWADTGVVT